MPYLHDSKAIAKRVRRAREEVGLSQAEMSKRLGLTEAGYGHYERDRQTFTVAQLFQLARILNRPVEWFLGLATELTDDELQALLLYRKAKALDRGILATNLLKSVAGE